MADKPTSYWDYIQVESLLSLQGGTEGDESQLSNDEVLFITVHQIDELWFKLMLRELAFARDCFAQVPVPEQMLASATRGLRRCGQLLDHIARHFGLMESMTTRDYLAFRDKLFPASGFQSAQLREIEILLGLGPDERLHLGHENSYLDALKSHDGSPSPAYRRVAARLDDTPTMRNALRSWLYRTPINGSKPDDAGDAERVRSFIDAYLAAHRRELDVQTAQAQKFAGNPEDVARLTARYDQSAESARAFLLAEDVDPSERARRSRIRAALVYIESYRELPLLAWPREILDAVVALEQAFLIFRQRHARMVERVIGRRTGTGGSAGVDYLDQTALRYRVFSDVWAVRTLLVRRAALPAVENESFYDFAGGH